jgi:hypothetical protein
MKRTLLIEFVIVSAVALGLYLPFLSIQYDPNGLVEAMSVEHGPLLNKNHLLYRPVGLIAWRSLQRAGYSGNSLPLLQSIAAVTAALGVGFAFLAFAKLSIHRETAFFGAAFLATSYTYWFSATDVFYTTMAGMFAAAAFACVMYATSISRMIGAGALTALSIASWQGSLFLIPALLLVFPKHLRTARYLSSFLCSAGLFTAVGYLSVAFVSRGFLGPHALWAWFTSYSENGTLPIWGTWESGKIATAALGALDSLTAVRLGAGLNELGGRVQLGRIAVDFSVIAFGVLSILAFAKIRMEGLRFIAAYLCFLPFIIWWDPGSHKWFLVPNIFLAAVLVCGLTPWLQHKYVAAGIVGCLAVIAGTNFVTTIRPRHFIPGGDRQIAECVAQHMRSEDLFVAAEWGWPEFLPYVHGRTTMNVINQFGASQSTEDTLTAVHQAISDTTRKGAAVYMADPHNHSEDHLQWLKQVTGLRLEDLAAIGGTPSFSCDGVTINRIN